MIHTRLNPLLSVCGVENKLESLDKRQWIKHSSVQAVLGCWVEEVGVVRARGFGPRATWMSACNVNCAFLFELFFLITQCGDC